MSSVSSEPFHQLVDPLPEAILLVYRTGTIAAANRRMGKLLQIKPDSLQGQCLTDFVTDPPPAVAQYLLSCSRVREPLPGSITLIREEGEPIPCNVQGYRVESGPEKQLALVLLRFIPKAESPSQFALLNQQIDRLKKEILLRKQVEEMLRAMDRRKDRFLAMLGHELRNPLNTLGNALYTLQRSGSDPVKQQRTGGIMERQIRQMNRIVSDLLDISRITQGRMILKPDRVNLTEMIHQIFEDQRDQFSLEELTLVHETPDQPVWVWVDPARLNQIVCNLLHNSRKFTPKGGEVTLILKDDPAETAAIIKVIDTGTGIAPERLSNLFETFAHEETHQDRQHGGLGLGLPLVKGLVELQRGSVEVISEGEGKGTEVTIQLPLVTREEV